MKSKVSKDLPSNESFNDYSLPRNKILRGKKKFDVIFREGTSIRGRVINLRFLKVSENKNGCLMGFVASKKLGNAVQRNHIRRLMREAYRLNQHLISDYCDREQVSLNGILIAKDIHADFHSVEKDCINLLSKMRNYFENTLK